MHVLCYGITPDDHEWLQAHRDDVETCAAYLHEHEITAALAHPFYAVAAPLTARHRRRLAELFPIWETRNGSRAKELNLPAFVYIETHGGTAIGGSDDHAGIDVGRTFTETPRAATPRSSSPTSGRDGPPPTDSRAARPSGRTPRWRWRSGRSETATARRGRVPARSRDRAADRRARDERGRRAAGEWRRRPRGRATRSRCCAPGCCSMDLDVDEHKLLHRLQEGELAHADLDRRARRVHERKLAGVVHDTVAEPRARHGRMAVAPPLALFDACMPAIPYAAAAAFLGPREGQADPQRRRPARGWRWSSTAIGGMHGVTHTIQQIRARGVRGFDVEVIGTDADVDRRLSAVAEIDIPFYPGLQIGVPTVPAIVEALAEGRYDLVHVCSPGPAGIARLAARPRARAPARRQLPHRARRLRGAAHRSAPVRDAGQLGPGPLLRRLRRGALAQPGQRRAPGRAGNRFRADPALGSRRRPAPLRPGAPRQDGLLPGEVNVLYAGTAEQGEGRRPARRRVPRGPPPRPAPASGRSPAAVPRRASCASASASGPRSSAGSRATRSPAPTPAPTRSCSPAPPRRSGR